MLFFNLGGKPLHKTLSTQSCWTRFSITSK